MKKRYHNWFEFRNDWWRDHSWVNVGFSVEAEFPRLLHRYGYSVARIFRFHIGIFGFHFYYTRTREAMYVEPGNDPGNPPSVESTAPNAPLA